MRIWLGAVLLTFLFVPSVSAQEAGAREGWVSPPRLLDSPALSERPVAPIAATVIHGSPSWGRTGAIIGAVGGLVVATRTFEFSDGCIGCGFEFVLFPAAGAAVGWLAGHAAWHLMGDY